MHIEKYISDSKSLEEFVFNLINEIQILLERQEYTDFKLLSEELVLLRNKAKELLNA